MPALVLRADFCLLIAPVPVHCFSITFRGSLTRIQYPKPRYVPFSFSFRSSLLLKDLTFNFFYEITEKQTRPNAYHKRVHFLGKPIHYMGYNVKYKSLDFAIKEIRYLLIHLKCIR